MKGYWLLVVLLFFIWLAVSAVYAEPAWWSIFSSSRSTHTPLSEQISLIKVTLVLLGCLVLSFFITKIWKK